MRGLEGKVAIVTGGATMIGAAIVRAFAEAGTAVALADIDAPHGQAVADAIGPRARFVATDLRRDEDIAALVEGTATAFGGLDFVVNAAAVYLDRGMGSTRAEWLAALDVNLVASVVLMQAALPHLEARRGAIVNVASVSGKIAHSGRWTYPVSKAAVLHLTRTQALDLAPRGIRVNAVSPGWTWSSVIERTAGGDRARAEAVAGPFHALGRMGEPGEVARAVLFLCSDEASFVTGADLAVDGGYMTMGPEGGDRPNDRLRAP